MFDVFHGSNPDKRCDGVSRRDFLRVGGLSAVGLSLNAVLKTQADAPRNQPQPRAQSVILIFLGGGLSHHDSFDMKPDAPEEIRGIYSPITPMSPDYGSAKSYRACRE